MISGGVMRGIVEAPAGIAKFGSFGPAVNTTLPPVNLACSNALPTSTVTGWTGFGTTVTMGTGFDRNANSGFVITDDATGQHFAYQTVTTTATTWMFSVYVKAGTKDWVLLSPDALTHYAYFDLATCTVGVVSSVDTIATITAVGGGWCRLTLSSPVAAGANVARIYVSNANNIFYAGDGTGTISVYGPQIELGSTATDYNRTYGTAYVTRRFLPPTISVVASPSGGDMVAAGATVTKHGTPTTVDGYLTKAVSLNGTTDYFDLGNNPRASSFTETITFVVDDFTSYNYLVSKGGDSAYVLRIHITTGIVEAYINGATPIYCGVAVVGVPNTIAVVYERIAAGTSKLRANLNGVPVAEVTNAGLLLATGTDYLGTDVAASPPTGHPLKGDIENYIMWSGWAASDAELAEIVKVYRTKQVAPHDTPTVECIAAPNGGDMVVTGATATKVGTPTTVDAYSYPVRKAVKLNGTTDWFTLGALAFTNSLLACLTFKINSVAAPNILLAKRVDNETCWQLYSSGANLYFATWSGASEAGEKILTVGAFEVGKWNTVAISYDGSPGDGSGVMRSNLNGTAASRADAAAPLYTSGIAVGLGARGAGATDYPMAGEIANCYISNSAVGTAAQLAQIVATLQGKMISQPASTQITYTCTATTRQPDSDSSLLFEVPANVPVVTSNGVAVFGANENSNKVTDSDNMSDWMKDAAVTISPNDALCPMSPDGITRMTLVSAAAYGEGIWLDVADTPCRGIWLAKVEGDPDLTVRFCDPLNTHNQEPVLTSTPTRYMDYYAGEHGIYTYLRSAGPARFCVWRATLQNTSVCAATNPAPKTTAGTPFVGSPSLLSFPTQVTDASNWTRTVRAKLGTWAGTGASSYSILWSNGTADANDSATLYLSGDHLQLFIYNGAAVKYWDCTSPGFVADTEHEITVTSVAGAISIYRDGRALALTPVGVGTGIQEAIPATVYIGNDNVHSYALNGFISDFREW